MEPLSADRQRAIVVDLVDRMRAAGSWAGETHIQKCVYVLKELADVPLDYDFVLYKHGPYSFALHDELNSSVARKVLEREPKLPYGPSYGVGGQGDRLRERFRPTLRRYTSGLDVAATKFSTYDVMDLERVMTALFITRGHPDLSREDRIGLLRSAKPHISTEQAARALQEVDTTLEDAPQEP